MYEAIFLFRQLKINYLPIHSVISGTDYKISACDYIISDCDYIISGSDYKIYDVISVPLKSGRIKY